MNSRIFRIGAAGLSWVSVFGLLTVLALGTAKAQSQDDIERAREQFQMGNEAYQQEQWQDAIRYFQRANEIAPNARLLLYIGQCYLAMDDPARALEYVRRYAESSDQAYAEVAELLHGLEQTTDLAFDRAGRIVDHAWRLARGGDQDVGDIPSDPTVVPIRVTSTPAGAQVFIDDESLGAVGRTPMVARVFIGVHHVIVRHDYYESYVERVTVAPLRGGAIPIVEATLERAEAHVNIRVNPIVARVTYVTGSGQTFDLGQGSYQGTLPAGEGVFIVQHAGEERRIERTVEASGEVESFTLNLDPADDLRRTEVELGTLVIRTNLPFATISVDGAYLGEGIGEFETDLRPGSHTVRVTQEGYETVVDNVRIASGERQTWNAPTRLVEVGSIPWGGIVTGTLSLGAIVTGIVFALSASDNETSFNDCQVDPDCGYSEGDGYRGDAKTDALIADVCFGVGAGLAVTSLVLFLTSGPEHEAAARIDTPIRFTAGATPTGWGVMLDFDSRVFSSDPW